MKNNYENSPIIIRDFLFYLETIKGRSKNTVNAYYMDLRVFFRFIKYKYYKIDINKVAFNKISISDIDINIIKIVNLTDVYEFLHFISRENSNSAKTRARKVSSIKSFYKYLSINKNLIENNPVKNLELPAYKKSLPVFMTLEQSLILLNGVDTSFTARDKCMILLLLNCGMRISELVGINMDDIIDESSIKILGKGNKERFVYLNEATLFSIQNYLKERKKIKKIIDKRALFISKSGKRIGVRRVQYIIEECLKKTGLSNMGLSAHKLRHTAATLMYQYGKVDIRVLKEILGHENINTTEIYTHVSNDNVKEAIKKNPLSNYKS